MDKELLEAIKEFRQAFVRAVGDQSPFAKVALKRIDSAVDRSVQRIGCEVGEHRRREGDVVCMDCGAVMPQSGREDTMACGHPLAEAYQGEDGGICCYICESA